eukprot:1064139-Pyramimonas_sp.AAC.1
MSPLAGPQAEGGLSTLVVCPGRVPHRLLLQEGQAPAGGRSREGREAARPLLPTDCPAVALGRAR